MSEPHTWTRSQWVAYWGDSPHDLRDLLWSIMVDTHKRMMAELAKRGEGNA